MIMKMAFPDNVKSENEFDESDGPNCKTPDIEIDEIDKTIEL